MNRFSHIGYLLLLKIIDQGKSLPNECDLKKF